MVGVCLRIGCVVRKVDAISVNTTIRVVYVQAVFTESDLIRGRQPSSVEEDTDELIQRFCFVLLLHNFQFIHETQLHRSVAHLFNFYDFLVAEHFA